MTNLKLVRNDGPITASRLIGWAITGLNNEHDRHRSLSLSLALQNLETAQCEVRRMEEELEYVKAELAALLKEHA